MVWGRNPKHAFAFAQDPTLSTFNIRVANQIEELTQSCRLIVTAKASKNPLLFSHHLIPGTHITAVGADHKGKQELDASVFDRADLIFVDSLSQCLEYGDLSYSKTIIGRKSIIELGSFLSNPFIWQDQSISVADLTGIAIEDFQIAKLIFAKLNSLKVS